MLRRIKEHIEQLITERFIPKLQKVEGLEYLPYDDNYGNYGIIISGEANGAIIFQGSGCKLGSKRYKTLEEIDLEKWLKQQKACAKSRAFRITKEYWDKQKKAYDEILEFLEKAASPKTIEIADSGIDVSEIRDTDIKIYLHKFPAEEVAIGKGVGARSPMRCVSFSYCMGLRLSGCVIPTSFKKQFKKILKEIKN